MKNNLKEIFIVLVIFLLLTLIQTYPGIIHFNTHLIGDKGDGWQNVWNMWWMKKAIFELQQNPYFTDYLFFPNGTTLIFHTLTPFNSLLSIPFQFFIDLTTTYNLIFIISFMLTGLGMYLLAFYLTHNKFASIVAGFLFVFCPHRMGHALGHLNIISTEFIPLYVLYLFKAFEENTKKNILLASLFLILTALSSWYLLFFCLIFTGCYGIYVWVISKYPLHIIIQKSTCIFVICFIALSPLFMTMILEKSNNEFVGGHDPEVYSADLLSFFIPSNIQTLSRVYPHFKPIFDSFTGNTAEGSNYIGYMVLILAMYAIIRFRGKNAFVNFLCFSGSFFLILSLGMHLHIKGHIFYNIPLIYKFFYDYNIFVLKFSGIPECFSTMVMFSFSLLAAFGFRNLLFLNNKLKRNILVATAIVILIIEYLFVPFETSRFHIPPFIKNIEFDKEDYGILYDPRSSFYSVQGLYYQTIHNKKMMGGFISRPLVSEIEFLEKTPLIRDIFHNTYPLDINGKKMPYKKVKIETQKLLKKLNIKYVIIGEDETDVFLRDYGFSKIYEDKHIKVYEP